jgi:hypothetical protein
MIKSHHPFVPPNFRIKVIGPDEETYEWLTRAESEDELRERLERRGYEVVRITPYDFETWKERARAEADAAQTAFDENRLDDYDFKSSVWSPLKLHLFELFDMKCAYCEGRADDVSSGDVEHYRPKNPPKEDPDHPGYYWLAYEPSNYLPSCEKCNRVRGKRRFFPVEQGTRAHTAAEIPNEKPLLLNPYCDEPQQHLKFLPAKEVDGELLFVGTVKGLTPRGETSVKRYNLNREGLIESRRRAQQNIYNAMLVAAFKPQKMKQLWSSLCEGCEEFSAAAYAQARKMWEDLFAAGPPD